MDGFELLCTRRSIRSYSNEVIPDDIITEIVKAGKLAATANNVQPWDIIVIKNREIKDKIAEITDYGKFIKKAPLCIIVFSEDTKYYLEDGCAATQNILLAARYFGIGTCWVAGDKKIYADKIRDLCGLKPGTKLISIIPMGYPASPNGFRERKIKKEGFKII